MRRALSGIVGALALAGCASALEPSPDLTTRQDYSPLTGYKCDEIQEVDGERFSVTTSSPNPDWYAYWRIEWRKQLADSVHLELSGYFTEGADNQYADAVLNYTLYVRFDAGRFAWYDRQPRAQYPGMTTEISAGTHVIRAWAQSNVAVALRSVDIAYLREGRGDVTLKLYDTNKVLQEATISEDLIERSIEQLRKMYASARTRAADKVKKCEAYDYDIVIIN